MQRSVDDLRASGIMSRIASAGQAVPDFTLPNASGGQVGLKALLTRGPLVLSTAAAGDRTATRSWKLCNTRCPRLPADPPERVAKVVRNAERGCFVMQALLNPVPVTGRTVLNGALLGE